MVLREALRPWRVAPLAPYCVVMRTTPSVAAGCALLVTVSVACGTRLPDSAFTAPPSSAASPSSTVPPSRDGVTATTITIGTIASVSNPFDSEAFVGPGYGLRAFVDDINRHGGIQGRRLLLRSCDDSGSGSQNVVCVHRLIDQDHVFALVSSSILNYSGARIVNDRGVPDIGAEPVDNAYTKYPHLWDITGESYPRNGRIGWNGVLHAGTEVYRYFARAFPQVPARAGVVYYNQASSKAYGDSIIRGLKREGYTVVEAEVNFALPDFDSVAIKFRNAGVRYVYDAIDRGGNERLCQAMDDNRLYVTAKVTTTQSWNAGVRKDYRDSPRCRNSLYATGGSRSYDAVTVPAVARFRQAMNRLGFGTTSSLSQWALEGWAGAQWFADAAASCGRALTRACVERFMARRQPYDAGGLLVPRTFVVGSPDLRPHRSCLNVVRWQDSANDGQGGWVEQVPDMDHNCFVVPSIAYRP
jgi:ABC-type branched-subunit amino acid transport system substrate-binding protein